MSEQLPKEELVIATTLHHEHRSIVKSLFSTSKIPIKLFSNGTLYTERSDPLSHEATRQINIKGATVRYHFADEGQRFTYRVSTIISLVSSLLFFGLTMAWTDRILMGELGNGAEDLQEHLLYFWPILLWISIDFLREYRNRATHSFNIDWDESMIVMKQFANFVEWYAEKFEVTSVD